MNSGTVLSALSKFELQPSYLKELCRTYPVGLVVFDAPYACDSAKYCREYCMKGEGELYDICGAILGLLDGNLLSNASSDESKVFYHKMKADYYRYIFLPWFRLQACRILSFTARHQLSCPVVPRS